MEPDRRPGDRGRFQFGLAGLMAAMTLVCLVAAAYQWFGPRPFVVVGYQLLLGLMMLPFAVALGLVLALVLWIFGYR